MHLAVQLAHQRSSVPVLVLGTGLLASTRAADRDRTVSRRSKPSSRTALMGEQPNPWDRLQPQDATSRHRGAKPCRRYGLLGKISLLSLGTFCPLSDRVSTHHGRITSSSFLPVPPVSVTVSLFYTYTQHLITNQPGGP